MKDPEYLGSWKSRHVNLKFNHGIEESLGDALASAARSVAARNRRELIVAAALAVIFAVVGYLIPYRLSSAAAYLIALWCLSLTVVFSRSGLAHAEDYFLPVAEFLRAQAERLRYEQRLLNSVAYWYVFPPLVLSCLFHWGLPYSPARKILMTVVSLVIGIAIVYLNRQAVKRTIVPLIGRVQRSLDQLEKE